jgi:putative transposase
MTTPAFIAVKAGSPVSFEGRNYRIKYVLGLDDVLGIDMATGESKRLRSSELRPAVVEPPDATAAAPHAEMPDLEAVDEEDWKVAQSRMAVIKPLLDDPFRTRAMVEAAAKAADVHFTTVYEWMRLYMDSQHLSSLIPRSPGRRKGTRLVDGDLEAIIASAIEDKYLQKQKRRPGEVVKEVMKRCSTAKLEPPHPNTVRKRIADLPVATTLRRRGRRDVARNLYEPIRGSFPGADFPFAIVQIDHTPIGVTVVDGPKRLPMGRPWLTMAIDVNTRLVAGYHLSIFAPSAWAAGACLAQAMLPKRGLLARLEVPGEWPIHGKIGIVHADNAREFKGEMMRRACSQYGIELRLRPIKTPHYGGHIERLMGTVENEIRNLPGATFANPAQRKGYDPDKEAVFTLDELEAYVVDWIVNVYNKRPHAGIGMMTPTRMLEIGLLGDGDTPGRGLLEPPGDPDKMRLDFLPFEERMVEPYGLVLDRVFYWAEVLTPWINAPDPDEPRRKRKFIVRRDPRLISPVHFWDPELKTYFPIHYRDTSRPPTSLWALREARRLLEIEGNANFDEDALFDAIARLDKRIEDAKGATKAARRHAHRQEQTLRAQAEASNGLTTSIAGTTIVPPSGGDDPDRLFDEPVQRHENLDIGHAGKVP